MEILRPAMRVQGLETKCVHRADAFPTRDQFEQGAHGVAPLQLNCVGVVGEDEIH